jgi:hypothetical protein
VRFASRWLRRTHGPDSVRARSRPRSHRRRR